MKSDPDKTRLRRGSMGMSHIVFFVVAAAAPMTAVIGATPPAFAFGTVGVPGGFILAGLLYLLFSVGFTAMTRHVKGAGGFYSYVSCGLGSVIGIAGALLAVVAYFSIQLSISALFSVFMAGMMSRLGVDLPWWVWALVVTGIVMLFGRRNIAMSGRILGVCMIAELVIVLMLDAAIVLHGGGPEGLTLGGFEPSQIFGPGLGVAMVFVLCAYIGFECTTIFGDEAVNPDRTIPGATYVAVILISVFYAFSSWAIVQYYGPGQVQAAAAANLEGFYFAAAQELLGGWSVEAMNLLLLTSLFAGLLSFHNTLNRYFYTFGLEGLAWKGLGRVHAEHGSPHVAGVVQAVLMAVCILAFALLKMDAYALFSWMSAVAILCIIMVQVLVSISVIRFFRRQPHARSSLVVLIAPALAAVGLVGAFLLISDNLPLLTNSDTLLVRVVPAMVVGIALLGMMFALRVRRSRPDIYSRLGRALD